jgi:hypothetical protein
LSFFFVIYLRPRAIRELRIAASKIAGRVTGIEIGVRGGLLTRRPSRRAELPRRLHTHGG